MKRRVVALVVAIWLVATGCQTVTVQVPPEADLQGIKTVAVMAADMPNDPAPVGVLLRSEASSRIRRLLPTLTLVEPTAGSDAVLRMTVVRHTISSVAIRVYVDPQTGQVSCSAWQIASLLVDAAVNTGETIRWQGILEAARRIDLPCVRRNVAVIPAVSPASTDPRLVRDVVDDLGRRLAGYARREIRALPPSAPAPSPTQDP
ncbi:MAG: hypothetical protein A2V59_04525 [Armatimonadetes bacterium RBG_19FT_COMBO_69_19]|nr:MAG: hypothetical protein A2V59_04525 [Armatimonadetes bacterium RBG_19FT_COMBO_69_19]